MDGVDMVEPPLLHTIDNDDQSDFCNSILSRYSRSPNEAHHHLCAAIGAMSQELKDQSLPLTPLAYFGATSSSLDRLLLLPQQPPSHIVEALLTILSIVLPRVSAPVLRGKADYLSDLLARVVVSKSMMNPGAAASGLKCVSILLSCRTDRVSWSDVSKLFGDLLEFVTDDRPKVRRQAHLCLRDVMQSFLETSLLSLASEAITHTYERFILLAGGSNTSDSEGKKGAHEVLYLLDALKDCLPLMPMKFSTNILKSFKSLLEMNLPIVTRRITDALYSLCLQPTVEVSSEVFLELLCSLAILVSANETSGDSMTFTARLLDAGMKNRFPLNRQSCVIKLPVIFSALRDILASEHEEPLCVAKEAFKNLIDTCIDEDLVKQGVDQIVMNSGVGARKSAPTIIEKVSTIIESLLDYRYAAVWDFSFQIVAAMFDKLGEYSSYFLKGTLKSLAEMQKLPDKDFPYRKQLHECVGSAVVAMGPESFLSVLPLRLELEDLSEANVWLFPILKQYTVGAHLRFFTESLLSMVRHMRLKSAMLEREGRIQSARSVDGIVYSLWSLLPSFCNYPQDTAENFNDLKNELFSALCKESDIRGLVCCSLQILIQQNKEVLEGKDGISVKEVHSCERRAIARYTPEVATKNMNVLRSSAHEFLPVLSKIFWRSSKDDGGSLLNTIALFASTSNRLKLETDPSDSCSKDSVMEFFKGIMEMLLKATQESRVVQNSKRSSSMEIDNPSSENSQAPTRAQVLDLASSLLPGLDTKRIYFLYNRIKEALKDEEGLIQKKAYKLLSVILRNSDGFISENLEDLLQLMIGEMESCHISAKRHRLDCLYLLILHVSKNESEQRRQSAISSFLTEIVLALKEVNKKTRNRAYEILVQIGHACGDEENGGTKEKLHLFFNMVAGGLAGDSPHMISAAVKGLARLAYEFTDLVSTAYNILPHTFSHFRRKNRELIKANLGLFKVLVAKSQAEGLQTHLRSMVEGLLSWQDSTKNHFKAKVKLLLEMLVKKCGLDAVKLVMPEEHMKLLTNIRKRKERKDRKLIANSEERKSHQSKATTSRLSRWNHSKIFSDLDDEEIVDGFEDYMDMKTVSSRHMNASSMLKAASLRSKRMHKASKRLPDDLFDQLEDEPLDLLDRQKTRSALQSSEHLKRKLETDDEPEIDSDGRLIIREEEKKTKGEMKHSDPDADGRSQAGSNLSANSHKATKRRKTTESGWAYTGSEYSSKKAGGDLKRKDKLEPYAYWPLDRKMVSRRPEQRAAARKGMASVVKLTKKLEGKSVSNALAMKGLKFMKGKKKGSQKKSR